MEHDSDDSGRPSFFASRANTVGFLAIAGYFLVTEHWAHITPFLPWLLLLACPLMHFFMHGRSIVAPAAAFRAKLTQPERAKSENAGTSG